MVPITNSEPTPLTEVSDGWGVDTRTQTSSMRTVPGPHLSSKTQAPSLRIVPGPH